MSEKREKKYAIRQFIIEAARIYSEELAGKSFLYVYGNEYFEVSFPTDHFLHLTGVESMLTAKNFYKRAKKGQLTDKQFYFTSRHPFANAKKKLPSLKRIQELTNDAVCILKEMSTNTVVYKLSISNLEFTLGLTEDVDKDNNKLSDYYLPMSLRVEESSVEKSSDWEIVDFILVKDLSNRLYDKLLYIDENKRLPSLVHTLVSKELLEECKLGE
jgi:hypothetical protein